MSSISECMWHTGAHAKFTASFAYIQWLINPQSTDFCLGASRYCSILNVYIESVVLEYDNSSPCSFCCLLMLINLYYYFPGKTLIWGLGWWLTTMALALVQCESKKNKTVMIILSPWNYVVFWRQNSHSFYFSCSVFEKSLGLRLQKVLCGSGAQLLLQFFSSYYVECRTDLQTCISIQPDKS